jgi:hypothetical protein
MQQLGRSLAANKHMMDATAYVWCPNFFSLKKLPKASITCMIEGGPFFFFFFAKGSERFRTATRRKTQKIYIVVFQYILFNHKKSDTSDTEASTKVQP